MENLSVTCQQRKAFRAVEYDLLVLMVWWVLVFFFGSLWEPFVIVEHHLNTRVLLMFMNPAFMTTDYPSSDGYFLLDNALFHKTRIISNFLFFYQYNEFMLLHSHWINRALLGYLEWKSHVIGLQLINKQQRREAKSKLIKISGKWLPHLDETILGRINRESNL